MTPEPAVARLPAGQRSRLAGLAAVAVLAAVLRLLMLAHSGGWHSTIEYDDGVHYGSSALLLHGVLPYRDYDFLQPPGITWLLVPAAAIGRVFGDPSGLVVARLSTIAAATATTVLLGLLVSRSAGTRRGLLAAGVYAVAAPAVVAGRTVMLEPWLSLLLVMAYLLLTTDPPGAHSRRCWLAGAALGLAVTVKLWGAVAVIVLLGWLVLTRRGELRAVGRVAAAAVLSASVVCLPFFVLAPGRMFNDVITAQLTRPSDGVSTPFLRWTQLTGIRPLFALPRVPAALAVAVAGCVVLVVVVRKGGRTPDRRGRDRLGWLMAAQLLAGLAMFAFSGPYFFHYGEFLVVPFGALLALALPGLHPVGRAVRLRSAAAWTAVWAVLLGGVIQVADGWTQGQPASVDTARLAALVRGSRCVSADAVLLLELANAVSDGCPPWPDPRGTALVTVANLRQRPPHLMADFYPYGFRRLPSWQLRWQRQLDDSSAVILTGRPCERTDWTPALCHAFEHDFRYAGSAGRASSGLLTVQVWRARPRSRRADRPSRVDSKVCCPPFPSLPVSPPAPVAPGTSGSIRSASSPSGSVSSSS